MAPCECKDIVGCIFVVMYLSLSMFLLPGVVGPGLAGVPGCAAAQDIPDPGLQCHALSPLPLSALPLPLRLFHQTSYQVPQQQL